MHYDRNTPSCAKYRFPLSKTCSFSVYARDDYVDYEAFKNDFKESLANPAKGSD